MDKAKGRQGATGRPAFGAPTFGVPGRAGLTLVELMISLVIFGVIIAVVFGFLSESRRSYNSTRTKSQYQQGLRAVMSLVSREVRSAGCNPQSAGFERFAAATATQLQCRADLNGDGDVADNNPDEDVIYSFDPNTGELSRDIGDGPTVILRGLGDVAFNYFDEDGNLLANLPLNAADRTEIRAVSLAMEGETNKHEPVSYSTRITVRNN